MQPKIRAHNHAALQPCSPLGHGALGWPRTATNEPTKNMNPNHSTKMKRSMMNHRAAAAIALLAFATAAGAAPVRFPE
jgi:hypothetical protein